MSFDPHTELAQLRQAQAIRRRRSYWRGRSQLDPHTAELLALHDQGATCAELQRWLASAPRRVDVHHSTVSRWLRRTLEQRQTDQDKAAQ